MSRGFILSCAKLIATKPEAIRLEIESVDEKTNEVTIFADECDLGRLIGKDGKMAGSIRTLVSGCQAKDDKRYTVNVKVNS